MVSTFFAQLVETRRDSHGVATSAHCLIGVASSCAHSGLSAILGTQYCMTGASYESRPGHACARPGCLNLEAVVIYSSHLLRRFGQLGIALSMCNPSAPCEPACREPVRTRRGGTSYSLVLRAPPRLNLPTMNGLDLAKRRIALETGNKRGP